MKDKNNNRSQCGRQTHYNVVTDKNYDVSFECIITSITAHPIRLAVIIMSMFVSAFKTAVILYTGMILVRK